MDEDVVVSVVKQGVVAAPAPGEGDELPIFEWVACWKLTLQLVREGERIVWHPPAEAIELLRKLGDGALNLLPRGADLVLPGEPLLVLPHALDDVA